jgi:hypothetical protein
VDDRVDAVEVDAIERAHVALDDPQRRVGFQEIAEPQAVEGNHLVARIDELWDQHGPLVAARAGDEDFHACLAGASSEVRNRCPGKPPAGALQASSRNYKPY